MTGQTAAADATEFPGAKWTRAEPGALGFDPKRLAQAGERIAAEAGGLPHRVLVVRRGRIAAEWNRGVDASERIRMASASKSVYSCMLGIAVAEGKIGSPDDPVVDYYPEMRDVPPGHGPKKGRHFYPENEGITFRQLIGNTSGYMKPGEAPGRRFHYQTFGMNILTHAIAAQYNLYKTDDPERGGGIGKLTEWRIRDRTGGSWDWTWTNFDLPRRAKLGVFGYYTDYRATARDMARMGLLWLRDGAWSGEQIVPAGWMRQATRTSDMVLQNEPREQWKYGLGFWTNDQGEMWPDLPRDSFAARGAGRQQIWACRSLDIVIVHSPWSRDDPATPGAEVDMILRALA